MIKKFRMLRLFPYMTVLRNIPRRKFIKLVGSAGTLVLFGCSSKKEKTEDKKDQREKTTPVAKVASSLPIKIMDTSYKGNILVETSYKCIGSLAIDPINNHVFFVQKNETGDAEGIYELVDGDKKYRLPGVENPCSLEGPILYEYRRQTKIAINSKNEIFIFKQVEKTISVYNLPTRKLKRVFRSPYRYFPSHSWEPDSIDAMAINPIDGKLYVSTSHLIDRLDIETGKIVQVSSPPVSVEFMCFDTKGSLYIRHSDFTGHEKHQVTKFDPDFKRHTSIDFQNSDGSGKRYEVYITRMCVDSVSGKLILATTQGVLSRILGVDLNSGIVSEIATLNAHFIKGLNVDKEGNIYVSVEVSPSLSDRSKGKGCIIKLCRVK